MKQSPRLSLCAALAVLAGVPFAAAQTQYYGPPAPPPQAGWNGLPPLDQLLAPVALFPDPLLGLLLPAATEPDDLQAAAAVAGTAQVNYGSWDPSVQGLAHYPDVIRWMADNRDWSQQLGAAFADQPDGVMDAVQDLRRRALAAGTLRSTPQELVVQTDGIIQILPQATDTIYIPQYDPAGVYFQGEADAGITWSVGLPAGAWLSFYPMWRQHALWTGDWYTYSRDHGGWRGVAGSRGNFSFGENVMGRAHEWHAADDAQIHRSNVQRGQRGSSALPSRMGSASGRASAQARPSAPARSNYGYQAPNWEGNRSNASAPAGQYPSVNPRERERSRATFPGDEYRGGPEEFRRDTPAQPRAQQERRAETPRAEQRPNNLSPNHSEELRPNGRPVERNTPAEQRPASANPGYSNPNRSENNFRGNERPAAASPERPRARPENRSEPTPRSAPPQRAPNAEREKGAPEGRGEAPSAPSSR